MRVVNSTLSRIVSICIYCVCLHIACLNIADREGRINPFDPNGDNWFPPTIDIVDPYKNGSVNDSIQIKMMVNDKNGQVKFVNWESENSVIQRIDSITGFNDTTAEYKTTITSHEESAGIDTSIETSFYKITQDFYYALHADSTIYYFVLDTLDTINTHIKSLITDSDTSFFASKTNNDSIFIAVKKYTTEYLTVFDTSVTLIKQYFSYSSLFSFTDTGSFYLYATAVDNDGLESEYRDSIFITIETNK